MWIPDSGIEVRKCRHRIVSFLRGQGLDIGCGDEKINKSATGIGDSGKAVNVFLDLSANDSLKIFSDATFDYAFSCHQLQRFFAWKAVLREWWRVIRPGGHLILYVPDPDYCPRIRTEGADPMKLVDLYWRDVWDELKSFGNARKISASRHNESNEYSWLLVVKKTHAILRRISEYLADEKSEKDSIVFPRRKVTNKECLVIRFGAIGDTTWVTPLFEKLKKDGYYVVYCTTERGAQVIKEDPNVDEFIVHEKKGNVIRPATRENMQEYWDKISVGFEKVVNLTQTCEGRFLKIEGSDGYDWPHLKRHQECNGNYQDYIMEVGGYPELKGKLPVLHFTEMEEYMASRVKESNKDKFLILWSLAGSAFHKVYPWSEYVCHEICHRHKDIMVITVGDYTCRLLEWNHPQVANKSGVFTVRQSMVMTKYADMVIGAETGILNVAAAFDTPKIVFLSHSSRENLTKYWKNCTPLWALDCDCHPCHKLVYTNTCPRGNVSGDAPKCMENIDPKEVIAAIEGYYQQWHKKKVEKGWSPPFALPTEVITSSDSEPELKPLLVTTTQKLTGLPTTYDMMKRIPSES